MNELNLTPEAIKVINDLFCEQNLSGNICRLLNAEAALQRAAVEEENDQYEYMFRFAYYLKEMREKFEKIETLMGYEKDRD